MALVPARGSDAAPAANDDELPCDLADAPGTTPFAMITPVPSAMEAE